MNQMAHLLGCRRSEIASRFGPDLSGSGEEDGPVDPNQLQEAFNMGEEVEAG
jgi:hypothetical protein